MRLGDTILAGGIGAQGAGNCSLGPLTIDDPGHNLESDAPAPAHCGFGASSDLEVANAMLATGLGANGGPTQTVALLAGAPEIGTGGSCTDPASSTALTVDQRGLPRPAVCDIGAFQTQLPTNTAAPTLSGVARSGQTLSCSTGAWTGDGPLNAAGAISPLGFSVTWSRGAASWQARPVRAT